jgi:hypothetical protein
MSANTAAAVVAAVFNGHLARVSELQQGLANDFASPALQ